MTDPAPLLRIFTGTDRFQPVALLGRGSMGVVYRVHDQETGTDVALKTLAVRDPGELYRLKNEFRSLAGVGHRNLVELYELFVDDRECFFTMELVDGVNLVDYVRGSSGGIDYGRLTDMLRQLVSGLAAIHAEGKLHRDVKPSNVLVTPNGRVVILDFGLVTILGGVRAGDTQPGLVGTLTYMAPEQAWGTEPNPAADWYSVGVMLYEALTGRVPFQGPAARLLADKGRGKPPAPRALVGDVPEDLDALATALLDPAPEGRPGPDDILARLDLRSAPTRYSLSTPHASSDAVEEPFVGRVEEIAELHRAFASLAQRQTAVVLVEGPSGIGKSELVRRFLRSIESDGHAVVLDGRCHPYEAVPYKALDSLIDRLSRFLLTLPEFSVGSLVPRHAGAVARLFPVLARVPALASWQDRDDTAEPYEVRRRGFAALRELLARIGDRQPLVLWIDDLQWGDTDSAVLLRELLLPPDPPVMLLVMSYRGEDRESAPLADTLKTCVGELPAEVVHRIILSPLSATETEDLAAQLCNTPAQERIAAIAAEASGSPFLVTQLARHAAARSRTADETVRPASLSLQTLLAERIAQLGATAQEILELVSIAGRPLERGIALEAAGIGEGGRPFISRLEHEGLLRTAPRETQPTVEVYHDRIREVIVTQISPTRLRVRHRQLAVTIERQPAPDPDEIFTHYLGAGDEPAAARHGVAAGDRAALALAFDRAAALYRQVLALKPQEAVVRSLQVKLAETLANAGRGQEAGEGFEVAAATLAAQGMEEDVLRLKLQAADQYLRGGAFHRGAALMRVVLARLGVRLPRTNQAAILSSLWQRVRLLKRGIGFAPREAAMLPARTLLRIDACWVATTKLSVLDTILSDGVGVRCLIEALDAGERPRIIRALVFEVARLAALNLPLFDRQRARYAEAVERMVQGSDDPYDHAWAHQCVGGSSYFTGYWRRGYEGCSVAAETWRQHCRGVAWEIATADSFALSALAHMGQLRELAHRLPAAIVDAEQRGDAYALTGLRLGVPSMVWLAQDRPDELRSIADEEIARWPRDKFLVQHYLHLIATVQADLYGGDVWMAWRRICEAWPRVRKSSLLNVAIARVDLRHLRARAALAAAACGPAQLPNGAQPPDPDWPRERLRRVAHLEARHLARMSHRYCPRR